MPPKTEKVGPGLISVGPVGTPLNFTAQLTSGVVTWKKDKEDDEKVLSNETVAGDVTYTASFKATVFQDIGEEAGFQAFTWEHKGEEHPFTYTPSTAAGTSVTGTITVDPIDFGGDVGKKPKADLEWDFSGEPTLNHGIV